MVPAVNTIMSLKYCTTVFLLHMFVMLVSVGASSEGGVSVGKLRSSADTAFAAGNIDEALKLWEQVITMEPHNDANYYKRFRIYLRQQKFKEALSDLNSALSHNDKHEQALAQRGKLHMRLGHCTEAEGDFKKLKGLAPTNKDATLMESAAMCAQAISQGILLADSLNGIIVQLMQ
jgi:tetratricopeptide (TPR) repeat protein